MGVAYLERKSLVIEAKKITIESLQLLHDVLLALHRMSLRHTVGFVVGFLTLV